jgi:hypothetical protein
VWKLYNTSSMDFHLFFCCHNVRRLQWTLAADESALIKPLWQARPQPDLAEALNIHMPLPGDVPFCIPCHRSSFTKAYMSALPHA